MSRRNVERGEVGERQAAAYLEAHGHRVIARNVRRREGEIDLVTVSGTALVFVEVKLRRGDAAGRAVESLTRAKQARLVLLAEAYAAEHPELPDAWRIDVVGIDVDPSGRVAAITHVENAIEDAR